MDFSFALKICAVTAIFNPSQIFAGKFVSVNVQVALNGIWHQRMMQMSQSVKSTPLAPPMVKRKYLQQRLENSLTYLSLIVRET